MNKFIFTMLGAVVLLSFTLNSKIEDKKGPFTVVIDAGHGGYDKGAVDSLTGLTEKELTLAISDKIELLNTSEDVNFVFTRSKDEYVDLASRPEFAVEQVADLFISLHIAASSSSSASGVEVYFPKNTANSNSSKKYGEVFSTKLLENHKELKLRGVFPASFYVLRGSECPAVLLELGFITNDKDKAYLVKEKNQYFLAQTIIEAVEEIKNLSRK